jgi:hypothetical protein
VRQNIPLEDLRLRPSVAERGDVLEEEHERVAPLRLPALQELDALLARSLAAGDREQSLDAAPSARRCGA